jgi:uncharacterized membrane protein (DUF2068 family)
VNQDHPDSPPGTGQPARFRPKLRYELLGCGLHGHELIGTDVRHLRPEDNLIARESGGLRWYRCLRCDSWVPLPPPPHPARDYMPGRDEIDLPLRGRPLRDRYVLRLIALDRVVHFLVLAAIAAAIFIFATDRARLHADYTRILADLQGASGGPINNTNRGIFSEINRAFALSTTKLYIVGVAVSLYTAILAVEAFGLWFARRWAGYLTAIETGVLIPFEIYELTTGISALKILTLIINVAVLGYLLLSKRLFGLRGGRKAEYAEQEADTGWQALENATPYLANLRTDDHPVSASSYSSAPPVDVPRLS